MDVKRDEVLHLQAAYVDAIRQRQARYTVRHGDRTFAVLPGVFPPYLDSTLMVRAMRVEPHEEVLDVGSGTGVIAVNAAVMGKRCAGRSRFGNESRDPARKSPALQACDQRAGR